MIKAVLYDLDGTLIDCHRYTFNAYRTAILSFGIKVRQKEIIKKCFNILDKDVVKNFNLKSLERFSDIYREESLKGYKKAKLFPDAIRTIKHLKNRGLKLGIGTLREKQIITDTLKKTKLEGYFNVIVTNEKKLSKDKLFFEAMKQLSIYPTETIIIGDAQNDIIAAKKLGIKCILFYPKENKKYYKFADLKKLKPDIIVRNHSEIIKAIGKLESKK